MAARAPEPVKVFAAVLAAPGVDLGAVLDECVVRWGAVDHAGELVPFKVTNYYEPEMGAGLARAIVSFERLDAPEALVARKHEAVAIEDAFRAGGARRANIDVGYFDIHKIVLGSLKYDAQKIHLGRGVYADIVARYYEGEYRPYDWTFPDFRARLYDGDFAAVRAIYKRQLRALSAGR